MNGYDLPPHVTYRQFDHWVRCGYIGAIDAFHGSGHPRNLDSVEYRVLTRMGTLVAAGLTPRAAAPAARQIVTTGLAALGGYTILPFEIRT